MKQVIVISYEGTEPSPTALENAFKGLISGGITVDKSTKPSAFCLDEKDQARAMAAYTAKCIPPLNGITVTVDQPCLTVDQQRAIKLAKAIQKLLDE